MPPVFRSIEGETRFMAAYDAVLEDWPVEYQSLHIPTRLGSTHLIASGPANAPVAILLPSMAGTATLWQPNVAALSRHFRTYAVDVIGQVGKSVPTRRIRSSLDFADWLVDVMDGLGVRRASLIGSSYGAFLAMNQALATPERVERLVLIGSAVTATNQALLEVQASLRTLQNPVPAQFARQFQASTAYAALPEAFFDQLVTESRKLPARLWREVLDGAITFDDAADLGQIMAPTLLLWGDRDALFPRQEQERLVASIPDARLLVYPETGHCPNWEHPERVANDLDAFMRQ